MNEVEIVGQIADIKETEYKNILMIESLLDILDEKGILSRNDVLKKMQTLDHVDEATVEALLQK